MDTIKKPGFFIILLIIILSISACQKGTPTVDPVMKITEVALTIQAEFTKSAALTPTITPTVEVTPTATEIPPTATLSAAEITPSATPTARTVQEATDDNAIYVADVTYPDGTIVKPGTTFVKTWRVKNTGETEWPTAYRLVYLDGLHGANELLVVHLPHTLKPNLLIDISVTFTAPAEFGTYYSYWRLYNTDLEPFGEELSLKIVVGNP